MLRNKSHAQAVLYACDILEILAEEFQSRSLEQKGVNEAARNAYAAAYIRTRDLIHEIAGTKWS